jgi:hypothetical protein
MITTGDTVAAGGDARRAPRAEAMKAELLELAELQLKAVAMELSELQLKALKAELQSWCSPLAMLSQPEAMLTQLGRLAELLS